jgi:hypothetical protein
MEGKCYDGVVEMEGSSGSGMLLRLFYGVYGTFHEDSGTRIFSIPTVLAPLRSNIWIDLRAIFQYLVWYLSSINLLEPK